MVKLGMSAGASARSHGVNSWLSGTMQGETRVHLLCLALALSLYDSLGFSLALSDPVWI
jgi:hypothetical protein